MKSGLHPELNDAKIICACGNVIETKSTKKEIKVDVCSKCHPFWTGNPKRFKDKAKKSDAPYGSK